MPGHPPRAIAPPPLRWLVLVIVAALLPLAAFAAASPSAHADDDGEEVGQQGDGRGGRFGAGTIADFLASMAKEPLRNFLMEQIGIKTTSSQLRDILDKLNQLQGQLTQLEAQLSAQINELKLVIEEDFLGDTAIDLQKLLDQHYAALGLAIERLRAARDRTPPDKDAIEKAQNEVKEVKQAFMRQAEVFKVTTLAGKIHRRLQPDRGDGVTVVLGKNILANHRIVTTADSKMVQQVYSFLEENQALATWMTVEYWFAVQGDDGLDNAKKALREFFDAQDGFVARQRDEFAHNGQHRPIPDGVAIDRGPDADVNSYTTVNKPEFALAGTGYVWIPSNPLWSQYDDYDKNIPMVVKRINAERLRGMDGWSVPSSAQINGLFSLLSPGERNGAGISAYLKRYLGDDTFDRNFSWVNDADMTLWGKVHKGWSADSLEYSQEPEQLPFGDDPRDTDLAKQLFLQARGGLLAVRMTGQAQYLP